jgi:hypothetical protein
MSSADQDEKLAQFRSLTGAPEPMARSYLEATNWDIEVPASSTRILTIRTQLKHSLRIHIKKMRPCQINNQPLKSTTMTSKSGKLSSWNMNNKIRGTHSLYDELTFNRPTPQVRYNPTSRFATLGDFGHSNEDDEDEGRQNFFAGGEKSYVPLNSNTN